MGTMIMRWRKSSVSMPEKNGYFLCYNSMSESPIVLQYRRPFWYRVCDADDVVNCASSAILKTNISTALERAGIKATKSQVKRFCDEIIGEIAEEEMVCDEDVAPPDYWCELPYMIDIDDVEDIPIECHSIASTVADIVASQVANALAASIDNLNSKQNAPWKRT